METKVFSRFLKVAEKRLLHQFTIIVRQEVDGPQARYLQLVPCLHGLQARHLKLASSLHFLRQEIDGLPFAL